MNDQVLSQSGIVCWLEAQPDGHLRLVMDDVERTSIEGATSWKKTVLFTWRDYDAEVFHSELSENELADIGLNVVSRLAALARMASRGEPG